MNKRSPILSIFVVGVAAAGIAVFALRGDEPVYQGKRLGDWLDALSAGPSVGGPNINDKAANAILQIGTNGLPYLVTALTAQDSPLELRFNQLLSKQSLVQFSFRPASDRYGSVLYAFHELGKAEKLGPAAAPVIHALGKLLSDSNRTSDAAFALLWIGKESVPTLTEALLHSNQTIRAWSAVALAKLNLDKDQRGLGIGTPVSSYTRLPHVVVAFSVSDVDVPAFVSNLKSPDASMRRATAEALGMLRIRSWANKLGPDLLNALRDDPEEQVRKAAADAFKQIDAEAAAKAGVK